MLNNFLVHVIILVNLKTLFMITDKTFIDHMKEIKKERQENFRFWFSIVVSIVALVVAVIALFK